MTAAWLVPLALTVLAGPPSPRVVAVFDIEVSGAALKARERSGLDEYLRNKVAQRPGLSVVPPSQIRKRLRAEKAESYRACYDEACQIEIGKELAADTTVSTKILKLGAQCVVSVTFYDLRRAASAGAADATGGCTVGALVRSIERAVVQLSTDNTTPRVQRRGVPDPERCPLPGTLREGAPPPEGRRFSCLDANNQWHGPMVHFHANGRRAKSLEYRDGKEHGRAQEWHPDGELKERGQYEARKKVGTWTRYSRTGKKTEEGEYVDGVKAGIWTRYNGTRGHRIETKTFADDLANGPAQTWSSDGSKSSEGPYRDGRRQGLWTHYRDGKRSYSQEYAKGVREGTLTRYADDGSVKSTQEFVADDKHGILREWASVDGKRYLRRQANYRRDELHGEDVEYYPDGALRRRTTFADGDKHGPYQRYQTESDGKRYLQSEGGYERDKKSGAWRRYRRDGTLERVERFRAGKKHGRFEDYESDGRTLRRTREYRADERHGKSVDYTRGHIYQVTIFERDKRVKSTKHQVPPAPWGGKKKAPRSKKKLTLGMIGSAGGVGLASGGGIAEAAFEAQPLEVKTLGARGPLAKDLITTTLRGMRPRLEACRDTQPGRARLRITLSKEGRARRVEAVKPVRNTALRCLRGQLSKARFPAAKRRTKVVVELDFGVGQAR